MGGMSDTQPENQSVPDPGSATPPPQHEHPHHEPPHDPPSPDQHGPDHGSRGGQRTAQTQGFFDQIRGLGVRRGSDRWVGGVCAGIARRFDVDPLVIRAAMIALLLFGIGFLAYLIAWAILPDEKGSILAEKAIRDGDGWGIFLLIVIALSVLGTWFDGSRGWAGPFVIIGGLVLAWYLYTQRHRAGSPADSGNGTTGSTHTTHGAPSPSASHAAHFATTHHQPAWASGTSSVGYEPPPATERARAEQPGHEQASGAYSTPKAKRAGLAGLLLVLGAAVLGYGLGIALTSGSTLAGLIAATGAAGLATMLLGVLGRRSMLSSLLSLGLAVTLLGSWGAVQVPQGGFGEQLWRPVAVSEQSTYSWAMGSATLDLRGITEQPQQDEVTATVSFGQLVIYVPEDVTTRVIARAQFGSISLDGIETDSGNGTRGGTDVTEDRTFGEGEPELTVRANARFGQVSIVSQPGS